MTSLFNVIKNGSTYTRFLEMVNGVTDLVPPYFNTGQSSIKIQNVYNLAADDDITGILNHLELVAGGACANPSFVASKNYIKIQSTSVGGLGWNIGTDSIVWNKGAGAASFLWGESIYVMQEGAGLVGIMRGANIKLERSAGTITTAQGIYVWLRNINADNGVGIQVVGVTTSTNNTFLMLGPGAPPVGNFSIYSTSTYLSSFAGPVSVSGNGNYVQVPQMTTLNRPIAPAAGMVIFNTDTGELEAYDGAAWIPSMSHIANRTITVAKDGSGEFTTIKAAQAAIGVDSRYPASSTDNRYLILVMPSSDVTDTVYHEANPIPWNKQYVALAVWGGHDTVKIVGDNDDDMFQISVSDCQFDSINVRRAAPSTAGKVAFKITGTADDLCFMRCKSNNFDIGWLNTVGENKMMLCVIDQGTGRNFVKCTGGLMRVYDSRCVSPAIINDYTIYCDGGTAEIDLFNFEDTAVAGGGTKLGDLYNTNGGALISRSGYHALGTNGAYHNGGLRTKLVNCYVTGCTNNIRGAGTGTIVLEGTELANSITYDIVQVVATCTIIGSLATFDVSKVSIVAGSTTIRINEIQERDTIPYVAGTWNLISEMTAQFTGVNVPQNMTNLGYRLIFVNVTALAVAGTLNLTTVGPGSGSYDPVTGALTPGDSEAIPIAATGWYVSSKRWYGTVTLSGAGGLSLTMTDYKVGRAEQNVPYILRRAKFITNAIGGGALFQVVIEKWDKTNGVTTVWDSNTTLGNAVVNGQQYTFMRDGLNVSFNSEATPPEFMIVRFVGLTQLGSIRMVLDKECAKF